MYSKAKLYNGVWLAPGSDSLRLFEEKKFKELDKHMAELDKAKRKLEGIPVK